MRIVKIIACLLALAGLLDVMPLIIQAQDGPSALIPDLTGLSVPAAAASLNRVGLALGPQADQLWTEEAGLPPNTIINQSIPPGQAVATGTAIGITVLRLPNVLLLYDAEGITLINQSGTDLDLNGLIFTALDGNTPATFPATNWLSGLSAGDCAQLWAVRRTGPSRPAECQAIQRWLSTVNPAVHFWTGQNGMTRFSVSYGGVERAICPGALPGAGQQRCAFFLPASAFAGDVTEYIYLAYTAGRLIVFNQTQDRWMPLQGVKLYNYNPNIAIRGAEIAIGDPSLYAITNPAADASQLAPGQCLFFTNGSPEATAPPQPCEIIARLDIDPSLVFWAADFEVGSTTDGQRHACPAASAGKLTLCIMPR